MISDASGKVLNRSVLDATTDAHIALYATGAVSAWHQEATRLLGHADADTLGQPRVSVTPAPGCSLQDSGFHQATETSQTDIDGAPVSVAAKHVNKTESEVTMAIGFVRDEAGHSLSPITAVRPASPRGPLASYRPAGATR